LSGVRSFGHAPERLRTGSHGEEVTRMQQKLGFSGSGYFGYLTKDKLASHQRDNNIASDGIYSPKLDEALGWNVFERSAPGSTSPPSA
jgi:peptidoglycan hydrolase-like protein with peptidoglycan-binding domain